MQHFSAVQLKQHLDGGNQPLLLDVREPWEYDLCHIPNSELVSMRSIPDYLSTLDPDQPIVVICHHGIRSRQVGLFLEQQGCTQVTNLTGGVDAWARQVDKAMALY